MNTFKHNYLFIVNNYVTYPQRNKKKIGCIY